MTGVLHQTETAGMRSGMREIQACRPQVDPTHCAITAGLVILGKVLTVKTRVLVPLFWSFDCLEWPWE